jgi:hypothetical protein
MLRRRLICGASLLGLIVAGLLAWHFYTALLSDKEVRDAIAEADRLDPGWRLEELEAKRAVIPAAENSAEQVLAIKALMSTPWPPESMTKLRSIGPGEESTSLEIQIIELPPDLQMNAEQTRELRAAMEMVKEPLAKARSLANYRNGRYPIKWSPDYLSTRIPGGDDSRRVTNLLSQDARLKVQDGDVDGALTSIESILSVASSFSDEPIQLSQIVRIASPTQRAICWKEFWRKGKHRRTLWRTSKGPSRKKPRSRSSCLGSEENVPGNI